MDTDDLFCGICGAPVEQDEAQIAAPPYINTTLPMYGASQTGKQSGSINKRLIIIAICIAASVIVFGVGLNSLLDSGYSRVPEPAPAPAPALAPATEEPAQIERTTPTPATATPSFKQDPEPAPAPSPETILEPELSAYEQLKDSITGKRDGVTLVISWFNDETTVFEKERNSHIWMMQSRDLSAANAYREVEPTFYFDQTGEVIKIGFPTTTRLYHLYKDGTGHFSNTDGTSYEDLMWECTIIPE